jgi:hypothetical protein
MAIKASDDLAVGLCFKGDVTGKAGRKHGRRNLPASLPLRSPQGWRPVQV